MGDVQSLTVFRLGQKRIGESPYDQRHWKYACKQLGLSSDKCLGPQQWHKAHTDNSTHGLPVLRLPTSPCLSLYPQEPIIWPEHSNFS